MKVQLFYQGFAPYRSEPYQYRAIAANANSFELLEDAYTRDGTVIDLPDDMCADDSGWVQWQCDGEGCEHIFETRTRPGGKVRCPRCSRVWDVPKEARMQAYQETIRYVDKEE